ncbi:unnamed protein product [Lampetra planeri]
MATPKKGSEALPAEHHDDHLNNSSPPSAKECRTFRTRLAKLLEAMAAMVAELDREEPAMEERAPELFPASGKAPWRSSCTRPPFCLRSGAESPPSLRVRRVRLSSFHPAGDVYLLLNNFQPWEATGWPSSAGPDKLRLGGMDGGLGTESTARCA